MKELINNYNNIFEEIKHTDEFGNEYWSARELMFLLEYSKWQNFHKVIKSAMASCENSSYNVDEQFTEASKPLTGGNGNIQYVIDYNLSRYACYLIAQNGDPRKEVIALNGENLKVLLTKLESRVIILMSTQVYNLSKWTKCQFCQMVELEK